MGELDDVIDRLASLFSDCPTPDVTGVHRWNYDTGRCDHCGRRFPYAKAATNTLDCKDGR